MKQYRHVIQPEIRFGLHVTDPRSIALHVPGLSGGLSIQKHVFSLLHRVMLKLLQINLTQHLSIFPMYSGVIGGKSVHLM